MVEPLCRLLVACILAVVVLFLCSFIYRHHFICRSAVSSELTGNPQLISEACLQCICEAQVTCEPPECRARRMCTHFRISQSYWADAGLPTVRGSRGLAEGAEIAYVRCIRNPFCAARAVSGYVSRHLSDCDGDGVLSCYDVARIHLYGHEDCSSRNFTDGSEGRLRQCLAMFSEK